VAKVPLTPKRKAYAKSQGGAVFYGKPLEYPAAVEEAYRSALEGMTRQMVAQTTRDTIALWPATPSGQDSLVDDAKTLATALAKRFNAYFDRAAPDLASGFMRRIDAASAASLRGSLKDVSGGLTLKTDVVTRRVREIIKATNAENVALIKSIPREYLGKVQGAVMRSITAGGGRAEVLRQLTKLGQSTEARAALIARDQTSKATTAVNAARMDALGVKEFEWLHSQGGREPRPLHKNVLNGNVYSVAEPPEIDDRTGERGLPGQLINCRCRMVPVISWGKTVPTGTPSPPSPPSPPQAPAPPAAPAAPAWAAALAATASDLLARDLLRTLGKRDGVEFLTALDDLGHTVVPAYRGERSAVGFSEALMAKLTDPASKLTLHHNHPSSTSLSPQDLVMMQKYPTMTRIWAHGHDGSSYAASRGERSVTKVHAEEAKTLWWSRVQDGFRRGVPGLDARDVEKTTWHFVNLLLQKQGRIKYDFTLSEEQAAAAARLMPLFRPLLDET